MKIKYCSFMQSICCAGQTWHIGSRKLLSSSYSFSSGEDGLLSHPEGGSSADLLGVTVRARPPPFHCSHALPVLLHLSPALLCCHPSLVKVPGSKHAAILPPSVTLIG